MSSRLNPRDYDLGELREALGESPRGDDGPGDGPEDGRPDDLSAIADLLHEDPGDGTAAERTADAPSDGLPSEPPASGDESVERSGDSSAGDGRDGPSGAASDRGSGRSAVGRMRRNAVQFARSASRDRTPEGRPRRRNEHRDGPRRRNRRRDGERSGRGRSTASGRPGRSDTASRDAGTRVGGFELLAAGSGGEPERPYLDRLPDAYRAQLEVFEWLEWLLGTCGRGATTEALAYYESVEWLSEVAREDLEGFLDGLSAAEPADPRPLGVDDHRESLRYVARLAHRVER